MDDGRVAVGKRDLCLDLLACGHSHAEKNFQGTVCGEVFSCDSKGIFYLGEDLELEKNIILIDLAVPRDIEPEVGRFEGVTLFDMDSFRMDETPAELQENLEAAGKIVREQMDEFFKWLDGKELIPRIQEIKENAVNDFNLRIMKPLKNSPLEEEDKEKLMSAVDKAMEKVVNKMLFGLRDSMNEKAFLECVAGLEKTYEK